MSKAILDSNYSQIIYEGILKKSPPLKSKSLFNMIAKFSCATDNERTSSIFFKKRWRKRYFILFRIINKPGEIHLHYFKSKPTPDSRSLGSINMENFRSLSANVGVKVNKPNVFSIQTIDDKGNDRIYYLSAASSDLMHTWVEIIVKYLDLNKNSRVQPITPTVNSPMIHSTRGLPRTLQHRPSLPGNSALSIQSHQTSPDISRMSTYTNQNDNSTAYYNIEKPSNPTTMENLEDPICTEEEDIYKFPVEGSNQHSYFNLDDDSLTPVAKNSNNLCQLFFGNDLMFQDFSNLKQLDIGNNGEYRNLKADDSVFDKNNVAISQCRSENFINLKCTDLDHDFNFELPTRIRSDDTSSTSSFNSSTNSSAKDFDITKDSISFKDLKGLGPPQVPKRLNILDNNLVLPPRIQPNESVLPTKPPKSIKSDNFDSRNNSQIDDTFITLNYLQLDNHIPVPIPNATEPYSSLNHDSSSISLDLKNSVDLSPGHDVNGNKHVDSIRDFTSPSVSDVSPIEYSEISEARTEGLFKLNERILKNE